MLTKFLIEAEGYFILHFQDLYFWYKSYYCHVDIIISLINALAKFNITIIKSLINDICMILMDKNKAILMLETGALCLTYQTFSLCVSIFYSFFLKVNRWSFCDYYLSRISVPFHAVQHYFGRGNNRRISAASIPQKLSKRQNSRELPRTEIRKPFDAVPVFPSFVFAKRGRICGLYPLYCVTIPSLVFQILQKGHSVKAD